MQIIANDYVLQRLQQLPLSSTRLARSTLRTLVLKMPRLGNSRILFSMSPKKDETAVPCCDPVSSLVLVSCLVSQNVFHMVSALQLIVCLYKSCKFYCHTL